MKHSTFQVLWASAIASALSAFSLEAVSQATPQPPTTSEVAIELQNIYNAETDSDTSTTWHSPDNKEACLQNKIFADKILANRWHQNYVTLLPKNPKTASILAAQPLMSSYIGASNAYMNCERELGVQKPSGSYYIDHSMNDTHQ